MNKIIVYIILVTVFFTQNTKAQKNIPNTAGQIGKKMPNVVINNIMYYRTKSARVSDFGGKLLILDFWATSCGSCIEKFPEEILLQKHFKDSIQFLLVDSKNTKDTKERVSRFFAVHKAYTQLPSVVDDTLLFNIFPHNSEPHYVWIMNNTILAITDGSDINEKNIHNILKDENLKLSQKNEDFTIYDKHKLLFINGNGSNPSSYLYRSILTPYQAKLRTSFHFVFDSNDKICGYQCVNLTKLTLFLLAYPEYTQIDANRIITKVAHPEDFATDSISENWKNKNVFIYEATFPATTKPHALSIMRSELDKFFHLNLDSGYREVSCLIIKGGKKNKQLSLNRKQEVINFENDNFLRDRPISDVISYLNSKSKLPVIDESRFIDTIRTNSEISDMSTNDVLELLKKNGFTINMEIRRLNFLFLSEKPDY